MAINNTTMSELVEYYNYVIKECSDPRVLNWPLIGEPWQLLGILSLYLYAVCYFLPSYMADKKSYDLKLVLSVYNIYQAVACIALIYGVATSGWTSTYSLGCQEVDYSEDEISLRMARFMWWHMILKMSELLETIMFLLRKKSSQVTFLHVYHHVSTLIIAWIACKYFAGGMISFTVLINSSVHILMYMYYFLSALGPEMQDKLKWVKPKITMIQMVQLAIILAHSCQVLSPTCKVPNIVAYIYLPNVSINIFLFVKLYFNSYLRKSKIV